MAAILHFFSSYAILIYLLLAIGLVFAIRRLLQARNEKIESFYGLEKEAANRHAGQSIFAIYLIGFLALAEMILIVFLEPNLPALSMIPTPTMNLLITPSNTLQPELLETFDAQTPIATLTAQAKGCILGQIMITSPKPGDVIKGQVIIEGTADIPNFAFYKYEFSIIGTDTWFPIQAKSEVKKNSELGTWDTTEITPGDYNLRLVVIDNQGNNLPACIIPVRVSAP